MILTFTALAGCSGQPAGGGGVASSASGVVTAPAAAAARGTAPSSGQRIFDNTCIACHQQNGLGIPGVYPSLAHSSVVLGDPAALARWVILGQRPDTMPAGRYATQMPPFGWLKPEDAASLLTYIRISFGNSAPAVDADTVAKAIGQ